MKNTFKTSVLFIALLIMAFSLNSCGKKDPDTKTDTKTETKTETKTDSGNDIDALITDYDKIMKEYVEVTKKFKKGDMSVTDKYQELGKRSTEFSTKLATLSPKMTTEQSKRLSDISTWAATEMQK